MPASTARGDFPYPLGDDAPDTDGAIRALAERVAAVAVIFSETTAAARPAPGSAGRLHRPTDGGSVAWDTGAAWVPLVAAPLELTAPAVGVTPLALRIANGQTATALEVRDHLGTVLTAVESTGKVNAGRGLFVGGRPNDNSIFLQHGAAGQVAVIFRTAAGQTANGFEVQDSAGSLIASLTSAGKWRAPILHATDHARLGTDNRRGASGSAVVSVDTGSAGNEGLVIRMFTGQTAAPVRIERASDGLSVAEINASGRFVGDGFYTGGTTQTRYLGWDFQGNGVVNTLAFSYPTDASQITFTHPDLSDGSRKLRAGQFVTGSNRASKSNIRPAPGGLDALRLLRGAKPVRFHPHGAPLGVERDGFIAEELVELYPQAVAVDERGVPNGIDYGALTPLLIGGFQELDRRLDELEQRVAALAA